MSTPQAHLAIYLNDHLAGATTALEVLDALAADADPSLVPFVSSLRAVIAEDRDELERVMRSAGAATSPVRQAVGWLGEKAAAMKVRLDDPSDRGLRTFELLELVAIGIDGKRALWASLRTLSDRTTAVGAIDFARLAQRADDQRTAIEAQRLRWAKIAFGGAS